MEPPDGWRLLAAAFCSAAAAMQQLEPTAFLAVPQQHNQQHKPTAWCCCNHRCAAELQRQLLSSAMDGPKADYDTRLYDVCRPWRGKRGDAFTVSFRPAFLNGLLKFTDDWNSLHEHALGTDYGGSAGPREKRTCKCPQKRMQGHHTCISGPTAATSRPSSRPASRRRRQP